MTTTPQKTARLRRRPQVEPLQGRVVPVSSTLTVNSLADVASPPQGTVTLRSAIAEANTDGGGDTIQFAPSLFSGGAQTLDLTLGALEVTDGMTIDGPGANLLTIDPDQASRIFDVFDFGERSSPMTHPTVTLEGLTLTGGQGTQTAGTTDGVNGGAIQVEAGGNLGYSLSMELVVISDCTITANTTAGNGGAIETDVPMTIEDSVLSDNAATNSSAGGAVTFSGNSGLLTITGSTVEHNSAGYSGGGISISDGNLVLTDSSVIDNMAAKGGGIAAGANSSFSLVGSQISGNTSGSNGGGVYSSFSQNVEVMNTTFAGNSSTGSNSRGGGLDLSEVENLTIENSTFSGNTAPGSGSEDGGLFVTGFDFSNQKSDFDHSSITLTNSTITGNQVAGTSGGAYLKGDNLTVASNIFAQNTDNGTDPDLTLAANNVFTPSLDFDHNLVGNNTGSGLTVTTGTTPDGNGNFIGSPASPIDPMLSPLGNYGGVGQTMPLKPGSPAIDHGSNPENLATDERGAPRSFGAGPDIGAFEDQPASFNPAVSVSWGSDTASLSTAADGLRLLPSGRSTDIDWYGIDQITLTLPQPATIALGDVSVTGIAVANYGPVSVSGSGTTTIVITLKVPIDAADRVTLTIGNVSIPTYTRELDVLPGDFNDDGTVNVQDLVDIRNEIPGFSPDANAIFADVDGSGTMDMNDYTLTKRFVGQKLPVLG